MKFDAELAAVTNPTGSFEGRGVAPEPLADWTTLSSDSFRAEIVSAGIERLVNSLRRSPDLLSVARLLGLGYFVGQVGTGDTVFQHNLNRMPVLVVWSAALDGGSGRVVGSPAAGAYNGRDWTTTDITVRATSAGRYAFLVL